MKGMGGQYLNEFVSLAVLALLALALIAGQAGATLPAASGHAGDASPRGAAATLDAVFEAAGVRADVAIAIDIDDVAAFLDDDDATLPRLEIRAAARR